MIIERYITNDEEEKVFTRWRNANGEVVEEHHDFAPYFYVINDDDEIERLTRLYASRFFGFSIGEETATSLPSREYPEGRSLRRVYAGKSKDVRAMRELAGDTWEADIHFTDRFCIDNYAAGEMPDWFDNVVRAGGFDMEWNKQDEITMLGFTTDGEVARTWTWHPTYEGVLNPHRSEKEMLEAFAQAFEELNPDLITTWAGNFADWPMLYKRFKHHGLSLDWASPLSCASPPMTHLPRTGHYKEGTQVMLGRMTLDLADRNHGFERVWRDGGNGQLADRRLGAVGELLFPDNPEWWKVDMKGMTHHDMWLEDFEAFCAYHRADILLTDRIDREYHVSRFFMALQRVCGVSFSSVFTVSRFARGLLRRRATWASPTGTYHKGTDGELSGGFVAKPKVGRFLNVGVFDFRAMYAEIQRGNNISPETIRYVVSDETRTLGNGSIWYQGKMGVLPQLQIDLAEARNNAKAQMKKHQPGSQEYAGFNTLQLAFKRAAASVYGLMGHVGHGESHIDVASAITFVGRSLVKRLMEICDSMGYTALAGHTDSAYISIGDANGDEIAKRLTQIIQDEFKTDRFVVEFEKFMKSWVAVPVKNRNFGWVVWPKEGLHVTGFEYKKSNASRITKRVQEEAFISLCKDLCGQNEIDDIVHNIIKEVRSGVVPRKHLVMRARLGKDPEKYGQQGGFQGAAKKYNTTAKTNTKFKNGDGVPHIYTKRGIEAFRTDEELDSLNPDFTTIIQKQVISPVSLIYEAMGWREPTADGSRPKSLW
tara:strand:- start:6222 stop:8519 length:2298 start_codon:yes stop_codon:yes gene_type:complete